MSFLWFHFIAPYQFSMCCPYFFSWLCSCVCVCAFVYFVFSSGFHSSAHLSSCSRLAKSFIQFSRFLFCHSVHGSFSVWSTFSVCLPTFYLSVYLCICLFALYKLLAYTVFPSLCQCFSSCQSFSLSVSPFVPYLSVSNIISHICTYVHLCVCEHYHCVHEHAWAVSSHVFALQSQTGCMCAMTVCVNHHHSPSVWGVKYFSVMKYISVLIIFDLNNRYWKEAANSAVKTSSISQNWLIHIVINYFSLNSWCKRRMHTYFGLILTVFYSFIENLTKQTWPCVNATWLYTYIRHNTILLIFFMFNVPMTLWTFILICLRYLLKIGEVDMVVEVTVEGRFLAVECGVVAISRPWVMMTVPTLTPAPKPHPSPPWSLRGMPSEDLSAWIKGQMSLMECSH